MGIVKKKRPLDERAWIKLYRAEARSQQCGRCAYCAAPIRIAATTADHVRPIKRGGATNQTNIKATCGPCNKSKGCMGAAAFLKLIRNPSRGDGRYIFEAWSRRRIWMKTWRACERITASAA